MDQLIVDDWAMAPMMEAERRDFLEICDARYEARLDAAHQPTAGASWHAQIADPTIADSILDRLVHNAHRIELNGESLRKKHGSKRGKDMVGANPAAQVSAFVTAGAKIPIVPE